MVGNHVIKYSYIEKSLLLAPVDDIVLIEKKIKDIRTLGTKREGGRGSFSRNKFEVIRSGSTHCFYRAYEKAMVQNHMNRVGNYTLCKSYGTHIVYKDTLTDSK